MKLLVQHLDSGLFLADDDRWVTLTDRPKMFAQPTKAISFCLARSIRDVRLVSGFSKPGKAVYFYPFGNDPAVKQQKKELRRIIADERRIRSQCRQLLGHHL